MWTNMQNRAILGCSFKNFLIKIHRNMVQLQSHIQKYNYAHMHVCAKMCQSCLTLCNLMASSLLGSSPWDFLEKYTGVGCHFLLQGIFLTQGSNPCILHLPALVSRFFITSTTWEAHMHIYLCLYIYTHIYTYWKWYLTSIIQYIFYSIPFYSIKC